MSTSPVTRNGTNKHSIRLSYSWNLCFVWRDHDAYDIDFVRSYPRGNLTFAQKETGLLPPIHPDEILQQDFMKPHLIGVNELALALVVRTTHIGAVICEQLGISTGMAWVSACSAVTP